MEDLFFFIIFQDLIILCIAIICHEKTKERQNKIIQMLEEKEKE